MTLVELLTVILLGSLLLTMVFMLYSSSSRSYIRQGEILEQTMNLRGGLANLSRQLRMAGNGFNLLGLDQGSLVQIYLKDEAGKPTGWFQYPGSSVFGARPVWGSDGGASGPDSITICALAPDFTTTLGSLAMDFAPSHDQLRLDQVLEVPAGLDPKEVLKPGDWLALVPLSGHPILVEADADGSDLRDIKLKPFPGSFPNGVASIPSGTPVYNVKTVTLRTYRIDPANNTLLMDSDMVNGDLMAENIEDLQISYCATGEPGIFSSYNYDLSSIDLVKDPVKAVRVVISSRAARPDPYHNKYQLTPIPSMNRTVYGPADEHMRRQLENVVQLRNY
jgi:hypothetical protein